MAQLTWRATPRLPLTLRRGRCRLYRAGFTLTEAVVAMAVGGIMVISLYSGMTSASYSIRLAREDLRATQVLLEKIERIRLCTWDQVNDDKFMPSTFTEAIYPELGAESPVLNGTIRVSPADIQARYKDEMRTVTVTVNWGGGSDMSRTRQMTTFVSRYGITRYLLQKS